MAFSLTVSFQPAPARADSWFLPEPTLYFSPGGGVAVRIVPRGVTSQLDFFSDLCAGKPDPGLPAGSTTKAPRAEIYLNSGDGSYHLENSFALVNPVSPVSALLSDDGQFLVTFDNWHFIGHGDHVVVIYKTDGSLIRSMSLDDLLTESDISGFPRSVSSMYWSGKHYIDSGDLVLRVATCVSGEPDCADRFADLRISLTTGLAHSAKKDLLPHWEARVELELGDGPASQQAQPRFTRCQEGWTDESFHQAHRVSFEDLLLERPPALPAFTEIALKSKIRGKLRFEVLVSRDGTVVCVKNLKSLPMGLTESATETLLAWRLTAAEADPSLRSALVTLNYDFVLVPPGD